MAHEPFAYLDPLSPQEVLTYYQKIFMPFLRLNKNFGHGLYKEELLPKVKKTYSEIERARIIINDIKSTRSDINSLYKRYSRDYTADGNDGLPKYVQKKAKEFLMSVITSVLTLVDHRIVKKNGQIIHKDGLSDSEVEEHTFKCFYWFENEKREIRNVKTGILNLIFENIDDDNYSINSARFEVFSSNSDVPKTILLVSKKVYHDDGLIYLFLANETQQRIRTQITMNVGRELPKDWKFLTATYSTIGPGNKNNPIVGLMIMEKSAEKLNDVLKISSTPEIYHYLHHTRLFAIPTMFDSLENLDSYREIQLLNKYSGKYVGYHFRKHKETFNPSHDKVIQFILTIAEDGSATFSQQDIEDYTGRVRILRGKDDALMASFDFLIREHTYRFNIFFDSDFKGDKRNILQAVYSGIERKSPFVPTAGRMIFRKLSGTESDEGLKLNEPVEAFIEKPENKVYVEYLQGLHDDNNYIEELPTPNAFHRHKVYDMPFSGTYYTFYPSTRQSGIYKVPLRIFSDGKVEMKVRSEGPSKIHKGFAVYNKSDRLSIYIEKAGSDGSFFHLLFIMGNAGTAKNRNHFFGVSSKIDSHGSPAARIEILVKEAFNFELSSSLVLTHNSRNFRSENQRYNGILTYLSGRANRIAVSKKTFNSKFERASEHNEYFYAACYLATKAANDDDAEKVIQYLYQAHLHGFPSNKSEHDLLLTESIESMKTMKRYKITTVPEHVDLPKLSFSALLKIMLSKY